MDKFTEEHNNRLIEIWTKALNDLNSRTTFVVGVQKDGTIDLLGIEEMTPGSLRHILRHLLNDLETGDVKSRPLSS